MFLVCHFGQEPNLKPLCAVVFAIFQTNKHTYNGYYDQQHLNDAKWFVHWLVAML